MVESPSEQLFQYGQRRTTTSKKLGDFLIGAPDFWKSSGVSPKFPGRFKKLLGDNLVFFCGEAQVLSCQAAKWSFFGLWMMNRVV